MGNSNSRRRSKNNFNSQQPTYPSSGNHGSHQENLAPPAYSDAMNTGAEKSALGLVIPKDQGSSSTAGLSTPTQYTTSPMSPSSPLQNVTVGEDRLEILKDFNTVFLIDDSSSMYGTRWKEARDAVAPLADLAARYDADGLDVHFLNHRNSLSNVTKANDIRKKFDNVRPCGATPTGFRLEQLLGEYLVELEKPGSKPKPVNFVVITDGEPTDDPESVIISIARRLDRGNFPLSQVGIQFIQVGNDAKATQALKEMDDSLSGQHGIRDIVDTTPYHGRGLTADELTKCLIGGINRRVDKERNVRLG